MSLGDRHGKVVSTQRVVASTGARSSTPNFPPQTIHMAMPMSTGLLEDVFLIYLFIYRNRRETVADRHRGCGWRGKLGMKARVGGARSHQSQSCMDYPRCGNRLWIVDDAGVSLG